MYCPSGMTYVTRPIPGSVFAHHAVIDWDNPFGLVRRGVPVVIELQPTGPQARVFVADEGWRGMMIPDPEAARQRLWHVLRSAARRRYHALYSNCEHFARFIAFGQWESKQAGGALVFGLGLAALAALSRKPRRRSSRRRAA